MDLRVVARLSVPYSFGRSGEKMGKRDSFGRSAGKVYGGCSLGKDSSLLRG